jgi:uncharacterized protein GlcG (DUF336 family)
MEALTRTGVLLLGVLLGGLWLGGTAHAQLADKKAVSLAEAKKLIAAAEAKSGEIKVDMCIVVVDANGDSIASVRMDDCQVGSVDVALAKARTAARFRRPSKVFEDGVAGGRNAILALGVMPIEGGVNLVAGGKTIGAIGCSGGTAAQDGQVCLAGAAVLSK